MRLARIFDVSGILLLYTSFSERISARRGREHVGKQGREPQKAEKPTMSVTVVRMIEKAAAGSRFSLTNTTGMIEDLVAPPKVAPRISGTSSWAGARRKGFCDMLDT